MRFTRRLPERPTSPVALLAGIGLMTCGALASCSTEDDAEVDLNDAGIDASPSPDDRLDSGLLDAPVISRDASPFDGGPRPVVCTGSPCATSLVTTLGAHDEDRSEGFCALLDDGTVACWGANAAGQLGRGEGGDSAVAERVIGLTRIVELDHTCARGETGEIWCWGTGPFLHDDAGTTTREPIPVKLPLPPAKRIATGSAAACAVVEDQLLCWGDNFRGQITSVDPLAPQVFLPPQVIATLSGVPIRDLRVARAVYVTREDGVTMSWGEGPILGRVSSLSASPSPRPIALHGMATMDLTANTACTAIGGTGYCWGCVLGYPWAAGRPAYAHCIDLNRQVPAPVVAPEPVVQIATTRGLRTDVAVYREVIDQRQRWCAVGASGLVYCWGTNASGQAGDGTKEHAYEAVKVVGLPEPAAQVRTTADATCALLINGRVYCWGSNYYGQLGNRKIRVPSLAPQEVVLP